MTACKAFCQMKCANTTYKNVCAKSLAKNMKKNKTTFVSPSLYRTKLCSNFFLVRKNVITLCVYTMFRLSDIGLNKMDLQDDVN